MNYQAIIFDSDGTLIDSETLGNQVIVECVAELGLRLTLAEAVAEFRGRKMGDTLALIEHKLGRALPDDFLPELRRRMALAFEAELKPMPGVPALLERLDVPFCVASNGPHDKMQVSLRATGLLRYFSGHVYSAYEIGSWKPEPGLFIHAARSLGAEPERCAVVEDSVLGVQAGIAAGMRVFGYAPGGDGEVLAQAGARVFSHMDELLPLLCG
ncbi:haloacid dehalogenase superfamily, subfamily IA, variant 3 with third motif having DD or ED/haloacid dehalogenase superfamily, subfamily IA, variant 1 with third motif having Dx(3-4)D or Dx(3-4)E [Methylomagnum ishizawai]|uniref:Haloacid dehalogenase superfamily, subfamily IA, variant 3 with third motif having DD or ED/haloacid dehalogenase superfamily, subfamily IA, variant 1 with third motif having Dx(3-4)D or Dx(3-4)E n=1 Tax=Methylomagnum ishizawai TaxID=1760988 RepID=A0A1Y6CZL4_9GAMM|nr:HAD-IA family hydrolase [Methylomagnum ishizawai]SMF95756.1 haloacid dehalogenase superfamily, subfamily IA, variant 3 with third motif having DD or ED/haloacid dehalogenase superfamily, subfamily IA, variant 1 with third motif having Dx(3-4)D or Dx(3-4)E [Methylomagnum ishizawai]